MNIRDYVFVINPQDKHYRQKFTITAVQTDFDGRITCYTVNTPKGYYDYSTTDLQYTTKDGTKCTPQMQLL